MPVRTVASQNKINFSRNYVLYAQGGAFYCFYALLSLDSLF